MSKETNVMKIEETNGRMYLIQDDGTAVDLGLARRKSPVLEEIESSMNPPFDTATLYQIHDVLRKL